MEFQRIGINVRWRQKASYNNIGKDTKKLKTNAMEQKLLEDNNDAEGWESPL